MADSPENRLLAGRYQLVSKLGQGGMGSVWCAHDRHLRIQVAIKLLDADIVDDEDARARFQREALSAAQLRSTHIVHITDHGIDGHTPFIAMELLEGESLAARLRRQNKLSLAETVQILSQVARALTVAHSRGIAHRDLKPDNVFIVREGDIEIVKVLDFGIAKRLDVQTYSGAVKTRTGTLLGTPYYMSPEQAHGKGLVDHRTDVWSFGVIGYECITGRRPFDEQTLAALLLAICSEVPPTPSSVALVPSGFDEWFSRATARDLARRFSSAAEAAQALAALGTATSEHPTTTSSSPFTKTVASTTSPSAETIKPSSVTNPGRATKAKVSAKMLLLALPAVAALGGIGWWLNAGPSTPESAASAASILAATPALSPDSLSTPLLAAAPSVAPAAAPASSPENAPEHAAAVAPAAPSIAPVAATTPSTAPSTIRSAVATAPSATLTPRSASAASVVTKPAGPTAGVTKTEKKPSVSAAPPGPANTPVTRTPSTQQKPRSRDYAGF